MNESTNAGDGEREPDLAALLRATGPRVQPTPETMAAVRAAVESEWRAACAARNRRRRLTLWAAAAGVAIAAAGLWLARPLYLAPGGPVASLERIEGTVEYRAHHVDAWSAVAARMDLRSGDELRTGVAGRAAIRLASGVSMRLDNDTRVALRDAQHARLRGGGVYVDTGINGVDASRALDLDTPVGTVRHLGTQYEARLADDTLRVGVREGLVAVGTSAAETVGRAGEQLTFRDGQVTRRTLAANADAWTWVASITPPFAIDGRSVDEFLSWAGRETGRQVIYMSSEAAQRAHAILLKGSVAGLTPDAAVAAVLATTTLRPTLDAGHIRVEAAAAP